MPDDTSTETTETTGPEDQTATTGKTFTQDEVNALMGRTRSEVKAQFADYDTLKERAGVADELERANMTETERLKAELATSQRTNADADERIATTMITTEIQVQAARMGVVDPLDAVALLGRTGLSYTEEAGVVGVKEALETLVAAKPYLKNVHPNGAPNLNGDARTPTAIAPALTADEREAAAWLGVEEGAYQKSKADVPWAGPNKT